MTNIESSEDLGPDSESDCIQPCKHHPVAPQYPNGNATKHLKTLSEFVKTVAEGLSRITFPRTQQQYSSVHVLLISWVDDDLGTLADLMRLKHIFDHQYRFSTTYFRIPSNDTPDFDLEEVISSTKSLHGRNDDGLLIVCYGGHGEIDKSNQHSIWKAWRCPPKFDSPAVSPRIDWSELQDRLMKSKGDVLFILDCCYAAGAVQTSAQSHGGQRNFLLASGNDKASNTNTLTKALIYELEDLAARPCTVYSLHHRLVANRSIHQWSTVPIHIGERRIILAPLPDPAVPASSSSQQMILANEDLLQKDSPCRILVSVTLTEVGSQSARDAWVEWIRDHAPANISAFDFLDIIHPIAALSTNSDFLILTLPVSVWNAMTPNPAVKFLSVVYSENLLYHGGCGSHEGAVLSHGSLRELAHGRFSELLGNDSLTKQIVSVTEELKLQSRLVASLRQRNTVQRHPRASIRLDVKPEYTMHPSRFFHKGKVFLVLGSDHVEVSSEPSMNSKRAVETSFGGQITWATDADISPVTSERRKVSRFVVIREGRHYCNVIPITDYGGQGVSRSHLVKSDHCIVYTGALAPMPMRSELPGRREGSMRNRPVRMDPDRPENGLDPMCRLNLASVTTVQHNIKTKSYGKISESSMQDLMAQFEDVWNQRPVLPDLEIDPSGKEQIPEIDDEDESEDESAEDDLEDGEDSEGEEESEEDHSEDRCRISEKDSEKVGPTNSDQDSTDSDDGGQDDGHEGTEGEDGDAHDEGESVQVDGTTKSSKSQGFV
jgi:hypothetical protein